MNAITEELRRDLSQAKARIGALEFQLAAANKRAEEAEADVRHMALIVTTAGQAWWDGYHEVHISDELYQFFKARAEREVNTHTHESDNVLDEDDYNPNTDEGAK